MKNPTKAIKTVSVILLILGILGCFFGIFMTVGGGAGAALVVDNADVVNSQVAEDTEASSAMNEINNYLGTDAKPSDAATVLFASLAILGVLAIISAIFDIISAIFGFKAAKGGSPKPAFVLGVISLVLSALSLVSGLCNGAGAMYAIGFIINLIIPAVYTYAAYLLKKQQA